MRTKRRREVSNANVKERARSKRKNDQQKKSNDWLLIQLDRVRKVVLLGCRGRNFSQWRPRPGELASRGSSLTRINFHFPVCYSSFKKDRKVIKNYSSTAFCSLEEAISFARMREYPGRIFSICFKLYLFETSRLCLCALGISPPRSHYISYRVSIFNFFLW